MDTLIDLVPLFIVLSIILALVAIPISLVVGITMWAIGSFSWIPFAILGASTTYIGWWLWLLSNAK